MKEKIVLITAGGHVSCFHSSMASMVGIMDGDSSLERFEMWGAEDGLEGFLKEKFVPIKIRDIERDKAGSIIGSDRKNPKDEEMFRFPEIMSRNNIYAVVMMGGDNHLGVASRVFEKTGARIVGWPKTMDGDLSSGVTLGYSTAVKVGAEAVVNHHMCAMTNRKVFYTGLFGRNTDWVCTAVGAIGCADRVIPCEQEYTFDEIIEKIKQSIEENKERFGKAFAVVPYSEGARINGVNEPPIGHQSRDAHGLPKLQPDWIGMELVRLSKIHGVDSTYESHTYSMRDGPPSDSDLWLSRMAGVECMLMIKDGDFGKSVIFTPQNGFYRTGRKPMSEVARQRMLKPEGYFDYAELKPTPKFLLDYGRLFKMDFEGLPKKENIVYRNMVRRN